MSGVEVEEVRAGTGEPARRGDHVTLRYTGYLNRGDVFQRDLTVTAKLGERRMIAGLERGVEGMQAGAIRRLRVSPHLAYGAEGVEGIVPPNAVLIFEVELLRIGA